MKRILSILTAGIVTISLGLICSNLIKTITTSEFSGQVQFRISREGVEATINKE